MSADAFYNEIDPYPAQWLRNLVAAGHIADGTVAEGDIRELDAVDLARYRQCHFFAGIGGWSRALRLAGWPDDMPVWTGSCPCQPFSAAGQGLGTDDERHLWPDWFRLIQSCRPGIVLGEQVASKAALAWWDTVSADLEGAGYAVWAADLCAASVGAPHIRQRLYWVAYATSEQREWRQRSAGGQWQVSAGGRCSPGELAYVSKGGRRRWAPDGRGDGYGPQAGRDKDAGDIAGRGAVRELADAMQPGRAEGRAIAGHGQAAWRGGADGPSGVALGDTCGARLAQRNDERGDGQPQQPAAQRAGGHAWSDCEWLPCRDGKARPVEPSTFPLAHGLPGSLVVVCPNCAAQTEVADDLRMVWQRAGGEGQGSARVLQPILHGCGSREDAADPGRWSLSSAEHVQGNLLRAMWRDISVASPPQGQDRHQQPPGQRGGAVLHVPFIRAQEAAGSIDVRGLWAHLRSQRPSQQGEDLLCWMCGRVGAHQCKEALGSRVGQLRAYGNAIVPQVAAEFVKAAMDVICEVTP